MNLSIRGMGWAGVLTMVLITAMTLGSELSESFGRMLAGLAGHHWIAKGLISLAAFAAASVVLGTVMEETHDPKKTAITISASALVLGAVIFAFYTVKFFG